MWEYKIIFSETIQIPSLQEKFNELGKEDWELTGNSTSQYNQYTYFYFRKFIKPKFTARKPKPMESPVSSFATMTS